MQTNDFAPVNLGLLKNVAKPFYDRLISVRFSPNYPWTNASASPDDYALANIGQVKQLFSFDLRAIDPLDDTDQNGLPDWDVTLASWCFRTARKFLGRRHERFWRHCRSINTL